MSLTPEQYHQKLEAIVLKVIPPQIAGIIGPNGERVDVDTNRLIRDSLVAAIEALNVETIGSTYERVIREFEDGSKLIEKDKTAESLRPILGGGKKNGV